MEDAYAAALQNSTYRKEHDKERTLQARQRLDKLEQGGKVLVKNLISRKVLESLNHIGNSKLQKLSHDIKMM